MRVKEYESERGWMPCDLLQPDDARTWFGPDNPFRWQRLDAAGGMELYLLGETFSAGRVEPAAAAGRFAPRVLDGLRQAGFF